MKPISKSQQKRLAVQRGPASLLEDFVRRGAVAQEAIDKLTKPQGVPPACAHAVGQIPNVCGKCGSPTGRQRGGRTMRAIHWVRDLVSLIKWVLCHRVPK